MAIAQLTLREIREKKGLNQVELEKASGHSAKSISKWEQREFYPRLGELNNLIRAMGGQLRLVADFPTEMFEIKWEKGED